MKSRQLNTLVVAERRPVRIGRARSTCHGPGPQATTIPLERDKNEVLSQDRLSWQPDPTSGVIVNCHNLAYKPRKKRIYVYCCLGRRTFSIGFVISPAMLNVRGCLGTIFGPTGLWRNHTNNRGYGAVSINGKLDIVPRHLLSHSKKKREITFCQQVFFCAAGSS